MTASLERITKGGSPRSVIQQLHVQPYEWLLPAHQRIRCSLCMWAKHFHNDREESFHANCHFYPILPLTSCAEVDDLCIDSLSDLRSDIVLQCSHRLLHLHTPQILEREDHRHIATILCHTSLSFSLYAPILGYFGFWSATCIIYWGHIVCSIMVGYCNAHAHNIIFQSVGKAASCLLSRRHFCHLEISAMICILDSVSMQ